MAVVPASATFWSVTRFSGFPTKPVLVFALGTLHEVATCKVNQAQTIDKIKYMIRSINYTIHNTR